MESPSQLLGGVSRIGPNLNAKPASAFLEPSDASRQEMALAIGIAITVEGVASITD
jgi:hypothetical protein